MTAPWFKARVKAWPAIRAALIATGEAWDDECIWTDLEWWEDQRTQGRVSRMPGRRRLRLDWGVSDWKARQMMASGWSGAKAPPAASHHQPVTLPAASRLSPTPHDGRDVLAEIPPGDLPAVSHSPPAPLHTRDSTEHRAQSTEEQDSLPASPPASPAEPDPLWKSMGLPEPATGVKTAHLTQDVCDLLVDYLKLRSEYSYQTAGGQTRKMRTPTSIKPKWVSEIRGALRRKPGDVDLVGKWTPKRIAAAIFRYAFKAPADASRIRFMRDKPGEYLHPGFLLREGRTPQWSTLAPLAVEWLEGREAPASARGGAEADTALAMDREALALKLWSAYRNGPRHYRSELEPVLGGPARFDEWVRLSRQTIRPMELSSINDRDLPFRRRTYLKAVRAWLSGNTKEVS